MFSYDFQPHVGGTHPGTQQVLSGRRKHPLPLGKGGLHSNGCISPPDPPIYVGGLRPPTPPLMSASGLPNHWFFNKDLNIKPIDGKIINYMLNGRTEIINYN